jgi:phospholipid transport system transporter-binding protein
MNESSKQSVQVRFKENEILLSGVLNFDTTPNILNLLENHLKKNKQVQTLPLILNLEEVTQSDSSGLALLTGLIRAAKKNNFVLKIINMPKKLIDLAYLSGLATVIPLN